MIEKKILDCYGDILPGYGRVVGVIEENSEYYLVTHGDQQMLETRGGDRLLLDTYIFGAICRFGPTGVYAVHNTEEEGIVIEKVCEHNFSFSSLGEKGAAAVSYHEAVST